MSSMCWYVFYEDVLVTMHIHIHTGKTGLVHLSAGFLMHPLSTGFSASQITTVVITPTTYVVIPPDICVRIILDVAVNCDILIIT